ncbi:MAG: hypothetical protein V4525_12885 [Pseudomonadota bacterium]
MNTMQIDLKQILGARLKALCVKFFGLESKSVSEKVLNTHMVNVILYLMTKYSASPTLQLAQLTDRHLKVLLSEPLSNNDAEIFAVIAYIEPQWQKLSSQNNAEKDIHHAHYSAPLPVFDTLQATLLYLIHQYIQQPSKNMAENIAQLFTQFESCLKPTSIRSSSTALSLAKEWFTIARTPV